jgi:hypothetical protein
MHHGHQEKNKSKVRVRDTQIGQIHPSCEGTQGGLQHTQVKVKILLYIF